MEENTLEVEKANNRLAGDFSIGKMLAFAAPTIFMMLFQGIYTIVDTIIASRFVDTFALSSINIVTPVLNIVVGLATMIGAGGSAIIARKMGNGQEREAKQNFTFLALTTVILGLVIAVIGLFFIDNLIYFLGASDVLYPYCYDYLSIQLTFVPINMIQVFFASSLIMAGKPELGFGCAIVAGLTNAILDFVFMAVWSWGIRGAAIATCIGYSITAIVGAVFFFKNRGGTLHFCKPIFDKSVLFHSFTNGSSEMVSQLSAAITTLVFNISMMALLGEDGVAAITIMIYSQFLLTSVYIGYSMGVAPIFSYNYGEQNYLRLKHLFKNSLRFIVGLSITIFLLSFLFGSNLVQVFTTTDSAVFQIAQRGFKIFCVSFVFAGVNIFASALFTALSNGKISALISFLRTFVFVLLSLLILPRILHVDGIWLAIPIAEVLSITMTTFLLIKYKIKYHYA